MKSIDLRLGNVKLNLDNFSLNHIEKKAVSLRQEIFEKIIKDVFSSTEKQAVRGVRCNRWNITNIRSKYLGSMPTPLSFI